MRPSESPSTRVSADGGSGGGGPADAGRVGGVGRRAGVDAVDAGGRRRRSRVGRVAAPRVSAQRGHAADRRAARARARRRAARPTAAVAATTVAACWRRGATWVPVRRPTWWSEVRARGGRRPRPRTACSSAVSSGVRAVGVAGSAVAGRSAPPSRRRPGAVVAVHPTRVREDAAGSRPPRDAGCPRRTGVWHPGPRDPPGDHYLARPRHPSPTRSLSHPCGGLFRCPAPLTRTPDTRPQNRGTQMTTDAFHVYDTTLRDGAQREGISYSVHGQARRGAAARRARGRVHRGRLAGRAAQGHRVLRRAPATELDLKHAQLVAFGVDPQGRRRGRGRRRRCRRCSTPARR